jgi:DNA-directed RNA polymerase subunit omega
MARITVEDCFNSLGSKFELSVLASYRAQEISKGAVSEIDRRNDTNTVVALREIASEHIDVTTLRHAYVKSLQLYIANNDVITEVKSDALEEEIQTDAKDLIEREFISLDEEDDDASIEDLEVDASDYTEEE